jgi:hypothetical protein
MASRKLIALTAGPLAALALAASLAIAAPGNGPTVAACVGKGGSLKVAPAGGCGTGTTLTLATGAGLSALQQQVDAGPKIQAATTGPLTLTAGNYMLSGTIELASGGQNVVGECWVQIVGTIGPSAVTDFGILPNDDRDVSVSASITEGQFEGLGQAPLQIECQALTGTIIAHSQSHLWALPVAMS